MGEQAPLADDSAEVERQPPLNWDDDEDGRLTLAMLVAASEREVPPFEERNRKRAWGGFARELRDSEAFAGQGPIHAEKLRGHFLRLMKRSVDEINQSFDNPSVTLVWEDLQQR